MQNVPECFRFLFEKYGRDILRNEKKFYALLTDFLPTHEKELKILKIVCNAGVYKDFAEVEESRYTIQRKKAIKILTDDYLLGEEWAEMAIGWLMEALETQPNSTITKKETIKPKQVKIQASADFDITRTGKLRAYYGNCQEVIIPNGVLKIGKKCFEGMPICKVVFPETLEEIEERAFKDCKELTEIRFPESLQIIQNSAFEGCKKLSTIKINPEKVKMQKGSFFNCALPKTDFEKIYKTFGSPSWMWVQYNKKAQSLWLNNGKKLEQTYATIKKINEILGLPDEFYNEIIKVEKEKIPIDEWEGIKIYPEFHVNWFWVQEKEEPAYGLNVVYTHNSWYC